MKNMSSRIEIIPEALLTVSSNVGHYTVTDKSTEYIVWAEDGEGTSLHANNRKTLKVTQGTIDYFTKSEVNLADNIESALTAAGISFSANSVTYEDETEFIHYEWTFEVS